jgi:proteasome lid subunit RPN8/RPN11
MAVNSHDEPTKMFTVTKDEVRRTVGRGTFIGVAHTHPGKAAVPSAADVALMPAGLLGAVVAPYTKAVAWYVGNQGAPGRGDGGMRTVQVDQETTTTGGSNNARG